MEEEGNKNYFALHAVIFKKKDWDLENAEDEVKNYIKNSKKPFYRETKSSYRFRNIPKQKFINKTFRTKNLRNGISLIMGELKPEFNHLEGGGLFDLFKQPVRTVKKFFSPRQNYNNTTTKNLNTWGNLIVQRMTIVRTPIMSILDKVINIISLGKWNILKREYGHDKLFHLALIADVGRKNLVIEKNEVININTTFKMGKESETMNVDLKGNKFTINEMLNKTRERMGDKLFFSYNGLSNNCQVFIRECLISEGLYNESEKNFVFQDLSELAKKFPSISKKIMNFTTTTGAVVNKLTGQGNNNMTTNDENSLIGNGDWLENQLKLPRTRNKNTYDYRGFGRKKNEDENENTEVVFKKRGRPKKEKPPPKPKKEKKLKIWYKATTMPEGYRLASMKEAIDANKVFLYGRLLIDKKLIATTEPTNKQNELQFISQLSALRGQYDRLVKEIKNNPNDKTATKINEANEIRKKILEINDKYQKSIKKN